jgi:hypothetical protein
MASGSKSASNTTDINTQARNLFLHRDSDRDNVHERAGRSAYESRDEQAGSQAQEVDPGAWSGSMNDFCDR